MRRREFIALIGGVAVAWPLSAPAQQPEQVRRIGALINRGADDPQGEAGIAAFKQVLQQLGWSDGRDVVDPNLPCCTMHRQHGRVKASV